VAGGGGGGGGAEEEIKKNGLSGRRVSCSARLLAPDSPPPSCHPRGFVYYFRRSAGGPTCSDRDGYVLTTRTREKFFPL
jgi:hypothetical protein